jgi:DNA-directed RNA polymerase specialized sigma24 family protein
MMQPQSFNALARLLRLRPGPAKEAARLVLVDWYRPAAAARQTGCTPQSVSNTLARCRKGLALARVAVGEQNGERS